MVEVAKADRSGRGVEQYCDSLIELLAAITGAARKKRHGRLVYEGTIAAGVPHGHKGIEAGFIASVK